LSGPHFASAAQEDLGAGPHEATLRRSPVAPPLRGGDLTSTKINVSEIISKVYEHIVLQICSNVFFFGGGNDFQLQKSEIPEILMTSVPGFWRSRRRGLRRRAPLGHPLGDGSKLF